MEAERLTKETAKKLLQRIKGETRGVALVADWDVIRRKEGEEGLKKLEAKMAELGYPLKFKEIKATSFYPLGLDAVSLLVISELFDYDERKIEELGSSAVKCSLFLKIFMKYFFSIKMLVEEAPKMWQRHFTVGNLEISEIEEKQKYAVVKLKNFAAHPYYCASLRGYFSKIIELATKSLATCQETKCIFRGDDHHEFLVKWK